MKPKALLILTGCCLLVGTSAAQVDVSNRVDNRHYGTPPSVPNATSGQNSGAAGISSSVAKNTDPTPSALNDALASDGAFVLQKSAFGGSFSGSVPDFFIGDIIPTPEDVVVDINGTPTTIAFRPQPVLSDPTETFKQYDPGGAPYSNFAFPGTYVERFYWSKHAEKIFASDSGRITVYWRSLERVDEESGENVYYVISKTFSVSSGAARDPERIYWTESRFNAPPVVIPAGVVQEVNVIYNSQIPETVAEEDIYQPEGGNGLGGDNEAPLPNRTIWYDFQQGLIKAYNKEGRVLVEYLGQPRDPNDATVREHLGMEIVDVIQEIPPTAQLTHLGERLEPTDGQVAGTGDRSSPDGKRLFDPREYTANPINSIVSISEQYVTQHQVEGELALYAVKENDFANQVQAYWMKASETGGLGIEWPKFFNSYLLRWPAQIEGEFALNARPADGGLTESTAAPLVLSATPELVYQDDLTEQEARLVNSQLEVEFLPDSDNANRSLLILRSAAEFWYVRVYSYLETDLIGLGEGDRSALEAAVTTAETNLAPSPDDPILQAALASAVNTLHLYDQFVSVTVSVGQRIEAPGGSNSLTGFISSGTAYNPGAYINPFDGSVPDAEDGAIIPVNARPGHDELVVWWYRKAEPPSEGFEPIYWPEMVGKYKIVWPGEDGTPDASEIVLAANAGTGDLPAEQVAGSLYVQNDPKLHGYNPNDEHAIKLESRYYALRDDLTVRGAGGNLVSSLPYVLIDYTDPSDGRPSMRAFRVLREKDMTGDGDLDDLEDITFRYPGIAGTPLQAPLPLSVMPVPLLPNKNSANAEVTPALVDPATNIPGGGLPAALSHYNRFTFEDRKGQKWIYRGPHDVGSIPVDGDLRDDPAIGMQFYYNTLEGFAFPDETGENAAPAVGTIVPYLRPYATPGDPGSGFDLGNDPASVAGTPLTVEFVPMWPDDPRLPLDEQQEVPELRFAETLTLPKFGLPQVRGNSSAEVIYQGSVAADVTVGKESAALYDPTRQKVYELGAGLPTLPGSIATSQNQGRTYFQNLPPHLEQRFYFNPLVGFDGALVLEGEFRDEVVGEDYLLINVLSSDDVATLKGLIPDGDTNEADWDAAIDGLLTTVETFRENPAVPGTYIAEGALDVDVAGTELAVVTDSDAAVDSYALAAVGGGSGYLALVAGDGEAFTPEDEPVAIHILKVGGGLYRGEVKPLTSSNPLAEQVTLQHTGDFAGKAPDFEFEWLYSPPVNGQPPSIPGEVGAPAWFALGAIAAGKNNTVFGGGTSPLLTMSDNYVIMRYRPLDGHELYPAGGYPDDETGWSEWTSPALVEGWIKRVLAGINPFNQRVNDFFNLAVDTDISLLTQAGTRWEGDVALTLGNINDVGLIAIYETVLNRGSAISIDGTPAVDYGPANDALLLAAGYLSDLYRILGDEAFADASNPMIQFDTQSIGTVADTSVSQGFNEFFQQTATSRFAFEGQVPSLLDEELVLLRGRDDSLAPGVQTAPAYNRFFWNYTRGIDAGEVIYALNYNIREKQEDDSDGRIDAADAQRQYPQGHGDAYGHYLTAIANYYRLLTDPQFSWAPRVEAVNILGAPVTVDYLDERNFAAGAVSLGRTAKQIVGLVRRQSYKEDSSEGWSHLRDDNEDRNWGMDEWATRAAQGNFFHWVTANALLPEEDTENEGVQKIDRTTVPELDELAMLGEQFQRESDEAGVFVNPLGLTANSLLFDISPAELAGGKTHFEQVYDRAVDSFRNAIAVFERASDSTRLLRMLENQGDDLAKAVFDQEFAFNAELLNIYGSPYPADIGPGRLYEQGYSGPDLARFMVIDRPTDFIDRFSGNETFTVSVPSDDVDTTDRTASEATDADSIITNILDVFGFDRDQREFETFDQAIVDRFDGLQDGIASETVSYEVDPDRTVQFVDAGSMGTRQHPGELQAALLHFAVKQNELLHALEEAEKTQSLMLTRVQLLDEVVAYHTRYEDVFEAGSRNIARLGIVQLAADLVKNTIESSIASTRDLGNAAAEGFPLVVGFSNDVTSVGRAGVLLASMTTSTVQRVAKQIAAFTSIGAKAGQDSIVRNLPRYTVEAGFPPETVRAAIDIEQNFNLLATQMGEINGALLDLQAALERVQSLIADGQLVQREREVYRKRVATIAQGYRTRDVAFRTFRTEALEQYQGLLDWAAKYAYLAAKAYDFETGLLGSEAGDDFLNRIVSTRSLGLIGEEGQPQFAASSTGDTGLSGLLFQLKEDWDVVEGRLGFNNPDTYGTTFSMRTEHFRQIADPSTAGVWQGTLQASMVDDLRNDPDVAAHALQIDAGDVPIPGIVIPFSTEVRDGVNFFGHPLAAGDHVFSPTSFATKIHSVGVVLEGYKGMDPCLVCPNTGPGPVTSEHPDALSATPYVYLIPVGQDVMRTPPLGDGGDFRTWQVHDHAMPLPYNIGNTAFSEVDYWTSASSLSEPFFQPRKHQAFRAVDNPEFFYSSHPEEFTNNRLVGRSVWNTRWKLVIPGNALLADPVEGLDRFVRSVEDIKIYLKTYSYSGN